MHRISCCLFHDSIVSPRRHRSSTEAEVDLGGQVFGEIVPEAVDEHAAETEDGFGAVAPPPHAGAVETDADEVSGGSFDHAGADVKVGATEPSVLQSRLVLGEVVAQRWAAPR
jgi:hypothetical protein